MRLTRSSSSPVKRALPPVAPPAPRTKRARTSASTPLVSNSQASSTPAPATAALPVTSAPVATPADEEAILLHPALTFKYEDARAHLEAVDSRWGVIMDKIKCKPFEGEQTEAFNPFRSLATSIIGQQVSWLAARSINHKFVRLFYPHLPEKLDKPDSTAPNPIDSPFPTPAQVLALSDRTATLRGAGLSGRKVEYIVELAERFHDGRFNAKKLWDMDDEQLTKTLIECRGIGIWTVHMFLIFSGKRPNINPTGDLGIQKGLCKWYTADPHSEPAVHARKLATPSSTPARAVTPPLDTSSTAADPSLLVTPVQPVAPKPAEAYPTPSTPSVDVEVTVAAPATNPFVFPETSSGITPGVLKARLAGKKLKGNLYLSPQEVEDLMKPFEPYRSVACFYLWSLVDG